MACQGLLADYTGVLGSRDFAEVTREDMQARAAGIAGVPYFILDGKVAVPGAVEPDVFLRVLDEYGIGATEAGVS